MSTKKIDIKEMPAYTVSEAAHYLSVPPATVRYWSTGQGDYPPIIDIAQSSPAVLSFYNLVELHVLAATRRQHEVSMHKVKSAIHYLKKNTSSKMGENHPLISEQMQTDGLDLFIEEAGKLVSISQAGQTAIKEVLSAALQRIERNNHGIPIRLFPFTHTDTKDAPALVVIDPSLSAGRPVISGTGLATEIIAERYKAGESVEELADDYQRTQREIEEAIRCELRVAA